MKWRTVVLGLCLLGACAAAGCGTNRTAPPRLEAVVAPHGSVRAVFPAGRVAFRVPGNWTVTMGQPPLVGTVQGGETVVAVWRYPRREPLPTSTSALRALTPGLLAAARARDPTFAVLAARARRLARAPAIELLGLETIAGRRLRVRSVHIFYAHAELVLDSYAPPAQFGLADHLAFEPLLRSISLA